MGLEQSPAIVLRVFPWSETSCVSTIYTRDFGKLSVLAKGARRPKSPFEAALDLLSICRVVFLLKSSDSLDVLTEAKLQRRCRASSHGLLALYSCYYVAELLDRLTDKGQPQPDLYELAVDTLLHLEDPNCDPRGIVLRWELGILRMTGHYPSLDACAQCGQSNTEDGWSTNETIFSTLAGGIVCDRCRSSARQLIRVPSAVIDCMRTFGAADWRATELTAYPAEHRAAVRAVVERYLTVLLDRKLQLHAYLEELGR